MEATKKARLSYLVCKAHWFQALVRQSLKPNVLSGHEGLSWAPPSQSPHFTHEKPKAGRAQVGCFTLWYLFMSMAWSWGENPLFRRHEIYCAASSQFFTP